MMAMLQRVRDARVEVAGEVVGQIGPGLLVLVCAERGDTEAEAVRRQTPSRASGAIFCASEKYRTRCLPGSRGLRLEGIGVFIDAADPYARHPSSVAPVVVQLYCP